MTSRTGRAVLLIALALVAVAVVVAVFIVVQADRLQVAPPSPSVTPSASSAPAAEVELAHAAVHSLGERCRARSGPLSAEQVRTEVDTVLQFARRYPEGRFPIDDETGSAVSLLLVARETLRDCSPDEARRVDQALPEEFQETAE